MSTPHPLLAALFALLGCATAWAGPEQDLVDVRSLEPSILVDLRFFNGRNFLSTRLYDINVALLRRPAAERLARVQRRLMEDGYGLRVLDAYRPHSVQVRMWKIKPDRRFVAPPHRGSNHGRAMAVDVALVDDEGNELDMGSGEGEFSTRSYPNAQGIGEEARENRQILTSAMRSQGFAPAETEWWHFNAPGCRAYRVLDVALATAAARPYRPTPQDLARTGTVELRPDPWGDSPDEPESDQENTPDVMAPPLPEPPAPGPLWHLLGPVSESRGPL